MTLAFYLNRESLLSVEFSIVLRSYPVESVDQENGR